MFTQANKDIARYVDRGDYFRDSLAWYNKKFLSPIPHWAYILVITVFLIYGTYIITLLFMEDLKVKEYPLPIYSVDQVKYFPHIKPLSTKKEPINVSIARYLTSQYVLAREKYDFNNLEKEEGIFDRNFIDAVSSARVSYEYDVMTSEENPNSPIVRYKSFTKRDISVDNVELIGKWDLPEKAVIYFTSVETSRDGESRSSKWRSEMFFSMNDLEAEKNKGVSPRLRFTVTSYNTKMLS
jgi:type IV secretory pathway component VirB8